MARPGQPLLTYPSGPAALAHPLTFLQNVLVYMDLSPAYVTLGAGNTITGLVNRGNAGPFTVQGAGGYFFPTYVASDPVFNGKPTLRSVANMRIDWTLAASPTAVERFWVATKSAPETAADVYCGLDSVGTNQVDLTFVPHPNVRVYDCLATNPRRDWAVSLASFHTPFLYNSRSGSAEWVSRLNGVTAFSAGGSYRAPSTGLAALLYSGGTQVHFRGSCAMYALCSSIQTPAVRAQFEAWAKAEFALAGMP